LLFPAKARAPRTDAAPDDAFKKIFVTNPDLAARCGRDRRPGRGRMTLEQNKNHVNARIRPGDFQFHDAPLFARMRSVAASSSKQASDRPNAIAAAGSKCYRKPYLVSLGVDDVIPKSIDDRLCLNIERFSLSRWAHSKPLVRVRNSWVMLAHNDRLDYAVAMHRNVTGYSIREQRH
jgi:hypothetical protein